MSRRNHPGVGRQGVGHAGVLSIGTVPPGPVNTVRPVLTLTGDGEPGDSLSWNNGTWTTLGTISGYTSSLRLNGVEVDTSSPYTIGSDEEGSYQVRVTATDEFGSRTKASTSVQVNFTPVELAAAVIALSGSGLLLPYRVSAAAFDFVQSVALQWLRNGSPVSGQTAAAYTGDATGGDAFILRTTAINGAKDLVSDSNQVTYVEADPGLPAGALTYGGEGLTYGSEQLTYTS
jgi:hypothetical protein